MRVGRSEGWVSEGVEVWRGSGGVRVGRCGVSVGE